MNNIIQQNLVYKTERGTPVTDSLRVARAFGKEHKSIIRTIRTLMGSAQNCAGLGSAENSAHARWFYESSYLDAQGKQRPMFVMNRDGFSLLAMGLTGAKALKFKIAFIDQFNKMEELVKTMAQQTQRSLPTTFAEALRLAAEQAEQIEEQQRQIERERPRVLFSQAVETSQDSILIGELAKLICQNGVSIGEKRLFEWLRTNGYLCQTGERYNHPTQKAIEMSLFELRKVTINVGDQTKVRTTTKVTGKGQIYFVNKFLHHQAQTQ